MRSECVQTSTDCQNNPVLKPVMKCPVCGEAMLIGGKCDCGYTDRAEYCGDRDHR